MRITHHPVTGDPLHPVDTLAVESNECRHCKAAPRQWCQVRKGWAPKLHKVRTRAVWRAYEIGVTVGRGTEKRLQRLQQIGQSA